MILIIIPVYYIAHVLSFFMYHIMFILYVIVLSIYYVCNSPFGGNKEYLLTYIFHNRLSIVKQGSNNTVTASVSPKFISLLLVVYKSIRKFSRHTVCQSRATFIILINVIQLKYIP